MSTMKTSAETMALAGSRIDELTGEIRGLLDRLRSEVGAVEASWKGTASGAFTDVMGRWDTSATRLNTALVSIGESITRSGVHYDATDSDTTRAISGAGGTLSL